MIALTIRDPRASFILKRLIFDKSPKTLSKEDFKMVHRELHDRLVINQERPFTTIPEAMSQIDTEFSNLDDTEDELKAEKIIILKEYNKYLSFMEKYFSINNSNFNKYSKKVFNYINKNLFMKQIFVDFADKGIEHFIKSK